MDDDDEIEDKNKSLVITYYILCFLFAINVKTEEKNWPPKKVKFLKSTKKSATFSCIVLYKETMLTDNQGK